MIKKIILFLICATSFKVSLGQYLRETQFIIITYEDDYSKGFHGIQRYFWITPVDSIRSFKNSIYPLFLSNFTKSQFSNCYLGLATDPTIPSVKPGDYDFDSTWNISHENIEKLIYKKRKLIQTVKKTWYIGNTETIKIYATAIIGDFCNCDFAFTGQQRYGYKGRIFMADNSSRHFDDFWKSNLADFILKQDYSNLNFKQIYY